MDRLDGSTNLPHGPRVRLRMPHHFDAARLRSLQLRAGLEPDDLLLSRLLRFDPRAGTVVVATILQERSEAIVGLAVMGRDADDLDLLLADEDAAPGVGALLGEALLAHAQRRRRSA
jgi:hypothetical protein